ncbi:flagellar protein FliT [Vibrio sp. MACH09]|uniref:flagellar protein FliT n=1 Tax=unclassified Vibrio TaxID=2614977 RepID=UPI0020A5FDB8|nr:MULTISPECIES: flagellar protein FliT [unclassified Vibrio]GLO61564.1 flagellar protein FliT [Vibrio sp. MACH09]
MRLDKEVTEGLLVLRELDQTLFSLFAEDELNSEEILLLVDNREQLLQSIIEDVKSLPDFDKTSDWQEAIERTKKIVTIMQSTTNQIGAELKKYRHGNKSVQRYQQFL